MPTLARIPIPAALTPVGTKCIQVNIPADPEWEGMFYGALNQLTNWSSYDRDDDHNGATVADKWKQVIADARGSECAVPIAFDSSAPCRLKVSFDGGETWTTIYDGDACIDQQLLEGRVAPGNPTEWTHEYLFTVEDGGWVANPTVSGSPEAYEAEYLSGQGWHSVLWTHPPSNTAYRECTIRKTWPSYFQLTQLAITFPVFTAGAHTNTSDGSQGNSFRLYGSGGNFFNACPPIASPRTFIVNVNTNLIAIECWAGFMSGSTADPGGEALITRVAIGGIGSDPGY